VVSSVLRPRIPAGALVLTSVTLPRLRKNCVLRPAAANAAGISARKPVFLATFAQNRPCGACRCKRGNRYLHIHPAPEWSNQPNLSTPASTPASLIETNNPNIIRLVKTIGQNQLSVREILETVGLKDRENLFDYSLRPAISEGFVLALYPDKPRHPRQKYLLTAKGLMLLELLESAK
jgi:hypothetical protein